MFILLMFSLSLNLCKLNNDLEILPNNLSPLSFYLLSHSISLLLLLLLPAISFIVLFIIIIISLLASLNVLNFVCSRLLHTIILLLYLIILVHIQLYPTTCNSLFFCLLTIRVVKGDAVRFYASCIKINCLYIFL